MKFYKYTLIAVATAMSLGFTACDDDDYAPGSQSDGVFFPSTQTTAVELETSSTSMTVTVSRSGLTDAATYSLSSVVALGDSVLAPENSPITVPSQVSFDANQSTVELVIPVDAASMPTSVEYTVSIALGQGTPTFSYGNSSINLCVVRAEVWGEWQAFDKTGLGTWTYALGLSYFVTGDDPDLPVWVRYNAEKPDQAQFLVEHWGYNSPLYINWNMANDYVSIPEQFTGRVVNVEGLGECNLVVMSFDQYYMLFGASAEEIAEAEALSTFDPESGLFEIAVYYFIVAPDGKHYTLQGNNPYGYEYLQLGDYADYSLEMSYKGIFTAADESMSAVINANIGASSTKAVFAASKEYSSEQELLMAVLSGAVPTVEQAPGDSVNVEIPISGAGDYFAVGVTYSGDEPMNAGYVKFTVAGGASEWKNCCPVEIVDGWITPSFKITYSDGTVATYDQLAWSVQGQVSTTTPGLYRLKSPWTDENCPLVFLGLNSNTNPTNIVIDAANESCVKIVPQYSGFTYDAGGDLMSFYISNTAGYFASLGASDDEILEKNYGQEWQDGFIEINPALFGYDDSEDFGYAYNSSPTAIIYFDFESAASAPAKAKNQFKAISASRFNACAKSKFLIAPQTTYRVNPNVEEIDVNNLFHIVK